MTNRDKLCQAIFDLAKDGDSIGAKITDLALRLSSTFPQSGMTIEDIENEISASLGPAEPAANIVSEPSSA